MSYSPIFRCQDLLHQVGFDFGLIDSNFHPHICGVQVTFEEGTDIPKEFNSALTVDIHLSTGSPLLRFIRDKEGAWHGRSSEEQARPFGSLSNRGIWQP